MANKKIITIFLVGTFYLIGLGIGLGHLYGADFNNPGHWLLLIFASLFSYNVAAFFFGWTIYGGPGGTINANSKAFNRIGGALVSGLGVLVVMSFWFNELLS